jgi:protein KTI12
MERKTQSVVDYILQAQREGLSIGNLIIPEAKKSLQLTRSLSIAELRRLKRQFGLLNKNHTIMDMNQVAHLFVEYIQSNI